MISIFFLLSLGTRAQFSVCGQYLLSGRLAVNMTSKHLELITAPNSQSRTSFIIGKITDLRRVRNYIDERVEIRANIPNNPNGMAANLEDIISVKKIPSDPLNESKTIGIKLIQQLPCKN